MLKVVPAKLHTGALGLIRKTQRLFQSEISGNDHARL